MRSGQIITIAILAAVLAGLAGSLLSSAADPVAQEPQRFKFEVQHIFILAPRDMSPSERLAKLEIIHQILRRIIAGEDFGRMAQLFSETHEPREAKADPIVLAFDSLQRAEMERLIGLEVGQVSPVIETAVGYELYKIVKKPPLEDLLRPTPTPTPTFHPGPFPPSVGAIASATLPVNLRVGALQWDERNEFIQISPLNLIPANPDIRFHRTGDLLYAEVKPATFYAPVEPPYGSEIIGFAVWHKDEDPDTSIVGSLYASLKENGQRRLIGRVDSDMPGPTIHLHQPGGSISERVMSDTTKYYVEVVLQSGDARQTVYGGHVAYAFHNPGGMDKVPRGIWRYTNMGVPQKVPAWARPTLFPELYGTPTATEVPSPIVTPGP